MAKNCREPFAGQNSRPISILPLTSELLERIVFEQVQKTALILISSIRTV